MIENPKSPAQTSPALRLPALPELHGVRRRRVRQVLELQVNPAIASHGGHAELVAVEGDSAFLRLGGGCVGCGMVAVTLKQGVESAIRAAVPEITRVVDVTDHAIGHQPVLPAHRARLATVEPRCQLRILANCGIYPLAHHPAVP